jgi:hypothetical protein
MSRLKLISAGAACEVTMLKPSRQKQIEYRTGKESESMGSSCTLAAGGKAGRDGNL